MAHAIDVTGVNQKNTHYFHETQTQLAGLLFGVWDATALHRPLQQKPAQVIHSFCFSHLGLVEAVTDSFLVGQNPIWLLGCMTHLGPSLVPA